MKIERFQGCHLAGLFLGPSQWNAMPSMGDPEYQRAIENGTIAGRTLMVDDIPCACFGIISWGAGRFMIWGLLDVDAPMLPLTRAVLDFLCEQNLPRVEAEVAADFAEGHRWIRMLGFTDDTPAGMRNYRDGETYHLYSRIR